MDLKNLISAILMSLCIIYVVILTFQSSRILAMRAKNFITDEEYKAKRKDIIKKNFITFIVLVLLTAIQYF